MGFLSKVLGGGRKRVDPYGLYAEDAEQLAAIDELRAMRVRHELVPPSHDIPEWMIFIREYRTPLVPDFLRETIDLCERIAHKHGGVFEGWAGLLTKEEKGDSGEALDVLR